MRKNQTKGMLQTPATWREPSVLVASLMINILALGLPMVILQVYDHQLLSRQDGSTGKNSGILFKSIYPASDGRTVCRYFSSTDLCNSWTADPDPYRLTGNIFCRFYKDRRPPTTCVEKTFRHGRKKTKFHS